MNLKANQKGFTIVELLIVIVVIAILAAISIAAYTGIQTRARNSSAYSLASQLAKKAEAYYAINGSYPTSAAQFNSTANKEPNLEGAKVTFINGIAPTATPTSALFGTTSPANTNALGQFTSGNRVLYTGTANGYTIVYLKDSGVTSLGNGTAPTTPSPATFGTNEGATS